MVVDAVSEGYSSVEYVLRVNGELHDDRRDRLDIHVLRFGCREPHLTVSMDVVIEGDFFVHTSEFEIMEDDNDKALPDLSDR